MNKEKKDRKQMMRSQHRRRGSYAASRAGNEDSGDMKLRPMMTRRYTSSQRQQLRDLELRLIELLNDQEQTEK